LNDIELKRFETIDEKVVEWRKITLSSWRFKSRFFGFKKIEDGRDVGFEASNS
jgi:hypothetical protein